MKRALILILVFGVGAAAGYFLRPQVECPKDLSRALEGCEVTAKTVNDMLYECEYQEQECKIKLIDSLDRQQRMLETLKPIFMER